MVLTSSDIFATCKGTVKESPSLLICVGRGTVRHANSEERVLRT